MGAPLSELIIEQVIRYGLADLHNYPSKIDMIFDKFLIDALTTQYGQKQIDSIKKYVEGNTIAVVQAWPLVAEKVPCYSIQLMGTEELPSQSMFDDSAGDEETLADVNTLVSFIPTSYDEVTGYIACPSGTDLSDVYVGALFVDANAIQFEIVGPILTDVGDERFAIAINSTVTLGDCNIIDRQNWDIAPVRETRYIENIQIGIHAGEQTNLCKYLYYLLVYFLQSKRMELENVGLQLHTFSVTDFHRDINLLPDNVTHRFLNLRSQVIFSWQEDEYSSLTSTGIGVKVEKDVWINDGDDTVITTDGTEPEE